jgi:hypothetical protein
MTLGALVDRGADEIAHYRGRARPPASPLEWLGIAVSHLPELAGSARTVDDLSGRARRAAAPLRAELLNALARELGAAAATIDQARRELLERHPGCGDDESPEDYSTLVEPSQRHAPRRSQMIVGAYASYLGGGIEAAGGLVEAELRIAQAGRWERADHERMADVRASQLHAALTNALGGLLAYARLLDEDAAQLDL